MENKKEDEQIEQVNFNKKLQMFQTAQDSKIAHELSIHFIKNNTEDNRKKRKLANLNLKISKQYINNNFSEEELKESIGLEKKKSVKINDIRNHKKYVVILSEKIQLIKYKIMKFQKNAEISESTTQNDLQLAQLYNDLEQATLEYNTLNNI
ncbi:hypothetical protein A3Q56_04962 [Intoshia linei]|uniref:Uncharacterized protein n=1 Tax=Intoshia linei TaxID=1819745 RepID=A0A177AZ38_9BILA|nr:hypothetical protein A3Q56_04962 [Intoshia linei]